MNAISNVLIYGGGAVGSVFGWRIAQQAGTRVSVVCRSNFDRIVNAGYTLETSTWGRGTFKPHHVCQAGDVQGMAARQPFDYIVCAQKIGRDQTSTIQELRRIVGPSTTLVSAQNGLDVEVPLRDAFPRNTVLSAICNIGCTQSRPGFVQQTARIRKEAFLIGIHSPSGQGAATDVFHRDRLSAVDHAFESTDFVLQERWRKLVFNNAWNPVAALTGLDTHQLLAAPHAIKFVQQLATEACEVAAASGVILDKELPAKVIELARRSAPICPSTLQDARNHRPMELEPMFGYLVSQAPIVGVPTPCTSMMYGLLQQRNAAFISLDHKARKPLAPSTVMDGLMAMSVPAGLAY